MMIFNLITICIFTILSLFSTINAIKEDNGGGFIFSLLLVICGILAIVFQSLNI